MAPRPKRATRTTIPAGKRSRVKKVPSKPARVPKKPEAARGTAAGSATPRATPTEWKPLLKVMVAIEAMCDEAKRAYTKWSAKPIKDAGQRNKCRDAMLLLGQKASDTLWNYQSLKKNLISGSAATPAAVAARAAFEECEGLGVGLLIGRLNGVIERIARRMAEPYSRAVQGRLVCDFHEMDKIKQYLSRYAEQVSKRLDAELPRIGFSPSIEKALTQIQTEVRTLIVSTAAGEAADDEVATTFAHRIPDLVRSCDSLATQYRTLQRNLHDFVVPHLPRIRDKSLTIYNDLEFLLDRVEHAVRTGERVTNLGDLAVRAATQVDERLRARAERLHDAVKKAQASNEDLRNELDRCRALLARAPFRNRLRRKPLPPWEDLSSKEQMFVAVLIGIREAHVDGPYFVADRTEIAEKLKWLHCGKPKPATWRILRDLEQDYEIIGSHQQPGTRAFQQAMNWYWIAEDAFEKYRPHVRAASTGSPAAPA